ncbi:MAG: membrane protein insertase YidC [Gammaproteobacteria bacterium]
MDFQRSFLLAGMCLTAFMLWTAWQEEHSHVAPAPTETATQAITDAHAIMSPSIQGADVPPVSLAVVSTPTDAHASTNSSHPISSDVIHIKTDVLNVMVDKRGGNVIEAKLLKYAQTQDPNSPPVEILNPTAETLYIAQSGLAGPMGPDSAEHGQAMFHAASSEYTLKEGEDALIIPLTWQKDGITVTKNLRFERGGYVIGIDYHIDNQGTTPWVGQFYGQIKRAQVAQPSNGFMGFSTYNGAAISTPEKHYQKVTYKEMAKEPLSVTTSSGWIAMQQHYFLTAFIPHADQQYQFKTFLPTDNIYRLAMLGPTLNVLPGQKLETGAKLFVGPEDTSLLETIAPHLELTIDYGWFWMISQGLFWVLDQFFKLFGNWGVAIILTTVLVKALFYKLSEKSYRSMANMRKIQPKMEKLKEKHGDDKQKMSQAMMELYKIEKINPLGGCLPILVQIPVFIALYWVLIESVELRHAPFMLWIHDLSAKDPYYVLPLIMGASMFIQQKLSPPPSDPTQAKVLMLMPIFFTAIFLNFPAGLVLYWVVNNILSISQQAWIMRKHG